MQFVKNTLAVLVMLGLIAVGVKNYAPNLWFSFVEQMPETGWTEEACQADPVNCLESTKRRLLKQRGQLENVMREIQSSLLPLQQHLQEREAELGKTTLFLNEGRRLYQQALKAQNSGQASAITFYGQEYSSPAIFKDQLSLLFAEQQGSQAMLDSTRETRRALDDKIRAVKLQRVKLDNAIREIDPKIALVKSGVILEQLDSLVSSTETVMSDIRQEISQGDEVIRSTQEIVRDSQIQPLSPPNAVDAEFEAFLQAADAADAAEDSTENPAE